MKAVVVFDVHDDFDFKSKANVQIKNGGKCIYRTHLKIRPLPQNMAEGFDKNFMVGWNACLEAMTGETE